jgi:hypothetical protein
MPITPVVPNRKIVLPPLEPHLGVMVLRHKVEQVWQQQIRLVSSNTIDPLGEAPVHEHGFPSSDG